MSVRNAAAAQMAMLAANARSEAEGYDSIGERGVGDRVKRVAAEIDLAVELLRNFDGPAAYDTANGFVPVEVKQEEALADWERELLGLNDKKTFNVGDRVRVVNDDEMGGHPVGTVGVIHEDDGTELPYRVYSENTKSWNEMLWHTADSLELEPEEVEPLEPVNGAKIKVNAKGRAMMGEHEFSRLPGVLTLKVIGDSGYFYRTEESYASGVEVLLARDEFEVVAVR